MKQISGTYIHRRMLNTLIFSDSEVEVDCFLAKTPTVSCSI